MQIRNKYNVSPTEAIAHLDVVKSRICGGDESYDAQRKESVDMSKEAIHHCMIATDVELDKCDEKIHYKCPHCGKILLTKWLVRIGGLLGAQTSFCPKCGKHISWANASTSK